MNSSVSIPVCQQAESNKHNYGESNGDARNVETQKRSGAIYRASGNLIIIRQVEKTIPHRFADSVRGVVAEFSPGARVRMCSYLRECLANYTTMVTLTYPGFYPTNGKAVKEHLRRFLQEVRREYCRELKAVGAVGAEQITAEHSSFWFLEFQSRGAPHFHIFTTWSPSKEWVSKRWYEIVGSEDDRHLRAGTRVELLHSGKAGTVAYASKYAVKMEQKTVPEGYENVGRFWGVYGRRTVLSATTFVDTTEQCFSNSYKAIRDLYWLINNLVIEGRAFISVRKKGVLVVSISEAYSIRKSIAAIHRIAMCSRYHDNMFCDAELDAGETCQ